MPESLTIEAAITEDIDAGSYMYVYADVAGGAALIPASGRVPCRPKSAQFVEHLVGRHLEGRHLQGVGDGGHLDGRHLEHEHLGFQDLVRWTGGHFYGPAGSTGTMFVNLYLYDRDGRISASSPPNTFVLINTSPRPARDLAVTSKSGDQLTFTFTASPGIVNQDGLAR